MKKLNLVAIILLALSVAIPANLSFSAPKKNTDQSVVQHEQININTATAETLATIPGIGPKKASEIITYREDKGKFKSLEDLVEVKGIGEKSLQKIRMYLTL